MVKKILIFSFLFFHLKPAKAQNWEPVPCFDATWQLYGLLLDSLHNELIINFAYDHKICGANFKGLLAYNGANFHDLDFGIDAYNTLNNNPGGRRMVSCIPYNGKTLFGGLFSTVGSNALRSEAMALWDGYKWDSFPKYAFKYNPYVNSQQVCGFLKDGSKLWIYGMIDTLGGTPRQKYFHV